MPEAELDLTDKEVIVKRDAGLFVGADFYKKGDVIKEGTIAPSTVAIFLASGSVEVKVRKGGKTDG